LVTNPTWITLEISFQPNTYQLKRFLIKCEIDYEIVVQKRDKAIFEWEKSRKSDANELLSHYLNSLT